MKMPKRFYILVMMAVLAGIAMGAYLDISGREDLVGLPFREWIHATWQYYLIFGGAAIGVWLVGVAIHDTWINPKHKNKGGTDSE